MVSPGITRPDSQRESPGPTERRTPSDAAAIMLLLGEEDASAVLKQMTPSEIRVLSEKVSALKTLQSRDLIRLLDDFIQAASHAGVLAGNYQAQLKKTLQRALGREQARCLLRPLYDEQQQNALEGLQYARPDVLAGMLRSESLQFQAAVLACLPAEQGAQVMGLLPGETHQALLVRIAGLESLSRACLQSIAALLQQYLDETGMDRELPLRGVQQVADIMNLLSRESGREILSGIRGVDETLAETIERRMLLFEHLLHLSREDLQKLLGDVDQRTLAQALKGVDEHLKEAIVSGLPKRAVQYLEDEMQGLGRIRQGVVDNARREILKRAESLINDGEITLSFTDEEMVE